MKKPNKRRPDRTLYKNAGVSNWWSSKNTLKIRRYIQIRGKTATGFYPGLGWSTPLGAGGIPKGILQWRG